MIQSEDHDDQAKIEHIKVAVKDHKEEVDVKVQEIEIVHHHQMIQHKKDDVVVNKNEEMKVMIQV